MTTTKHYFMMTGGYWRRFGFVSTKHTTTDYGAKRRVRDENEK